jgi:hypothetical protein
MFECMEDVVTRGRIAILTPIKHTFQQTAKVGQLLKIP